MSKVVPTPYMWAFQPQMGAAAGASQDYSTQMNWMSAGPSMINAVRNIRDQRNRILMSQALLTETPRPVANPPLWPAQLLPQLGGPPVTLALPRNEPLEQEMTNSGLQIAGGGGPVNDKSNRAAVLGIRGGAGGADLTATREASLERAVEEPYGPEIQVLPVPRHFRLGGAGRDIQVQPIPRHFRVGGAGLQLNEHSFSPSSVRPDGTFQLAGGSRPPPTLTRRLLTLQRSSSVPRSGGIGSAQFVSEFVPAVYFNPFSGPPDSFPDQFIPNFDIISNSVNGYD